MRPLPVVVSTLWWSALTVVYFAYAARAAFALDFDSMEGKIAAGVLAVLLFLTLSILWFLWSYWQGQDWTRTFVLVGLILKAAYYLRLAGHVRSPGYDFGGQLLFVRVADCLFSIYIFFWLLTKPARRYFSFHAKVN
jgi:hypothetical protein